MISATPRTPWTPWTGPCSTAGSSASRWPATAGPRILTTADGDRRPGATEAEATGAAVGGGREGARGEGAVGGGASGPGTRPAPEGEVGGYRKGVRRSGLKGASSGEEAAVWPGGGEACRGVDFSGEVGGKIMRPRGVGAAGTESACSY